jgi:hypothetical protein
MEKINYFFTGAFALEFFVKIVAQGKHYFS